MKGFFLHFSAINPLSTQYLTSEKMIKVVVNVLGVYALKDGRIIKRVSFPADAKEVALRLAASEEGVCGEEEQMVRELSSSGVKEVFVQNPSRFLGKGFNISFREDSKATDPFMIAQEIGFPEDDLRRLMAAANVELTKMKLRAQERDQILMQAVSSLDDLEEVSNRLMERLREWYSLCFPELEVLVVNPSLYARLVADPGNTGVDGGLMKQIEDARRDSVGMAFTESDMAEVRRLASLMVAVDSFRADTEAYIAGLMEEIAPNTMELCRAFAWGAAYICCRRIGASFKASGEHYTGSWRRGGVFQVSAERGASAEAWDNLSAS